MLQTDGLKVQDPTGGWGEEMLWCCIKCRESDSVERGRTRLEAKIDAMTEIIERMTKRMIELEESKVERESKIEKMISESVEEKVKEAMNEAREREKRKLNVILVNVPESEGESAEERKKGDLEQVGNIAGKITEVERDDFRDPIRLGGKTIGSESKPRMLRVTVKNEDVKKRVLANARKLNEGVNFKNRVYINPDRTEGERREFRQLREELERRKKDDPNLIIRGGMIVRRKTEEKESEKEGGQGK